MINFLYFGVLIVGFYFLLVRPQRKQMAARRALVAAVQVGDEVVTAGGIHGHRHGHRPPKAALMSRSMAAQTATAPPAASRLPLRCISRAMAWSQRVP